MYGDYITYKHTTYLTFAISAIQSERHVLVREGHRLMNQNSSWFLGYITECGKIKPMIREILCILK